MAQHIGTVVWFNNAKGFGFLAREGGPDTFVHYSSIVSEGYKTLREGEGVTFDIVQGPQGLQAADVRRVEADQQQAAKAGSSLPKSSALAPNAHILRASSHAPHEGFDVYPSQ